MEARRQGQSGRSPSRGRGWEPCGIHVRGAGVQVGHPGHPGRKGVREPGDEVGNSVSCWQEAEEGSSSFEVVTGLLNTCKQQGCGVGRQKPDLNPSSARGQL